MQQPKSKRQKEVFKFKEFVIAQDQCSMKVGTDGILLGAWANVSGVQRILDIGTGTGLIALMLAQRSKAKVHAVEIQEAAWQQAKANFSAAPWSERLQAFHVPIQDYFRQTRETYDLIVSNPPFFTGGTFSNNQDRHEVRHTVKLPTGDLLVAARNLLSTEGRFCVVLPVIEGLRFIERAKTYGLYCNKITEVLPKPGKSANRLLMEFEKIQKQLMENQLVVWEAEDKYSKEFCELTKNFYLFL